MRGHSLAVGEGWAIESGVWGGSGSGAGRGKERNKRGKKIKKERIMVILEYSRLYVEETFIF